MDLAARLHLADLRQGNRLMLDILLIPPICSAFDKSEYKTFIPLGLMALCAGLKEKKLHAEIYKPVTALFSDGDLLSTAKDITKYNSNIVGFSTWGSSYPISLLLAKEIKSTNRDIVILFGGPHATIVGKETLKAFDYVDFVLSGEADKTICDFVSGIRKGDNHNLIKTEGLIYKKITNGSISSVVQNDLPVLVEDLDKLPIPSYDKYPITAQRITLDVGRGCPFNCTFCTTSYFFSKAYRMKSIPRILQEMDYLFEYFGCIKFDFTHDMFTLNKKFVKDFCSCLIEKNGKSPHKYSWTCSARIDCVDHSLLKQLSNAGCTKIFFGIESGSTRIQKIIKKHLKIEKIHEVLKSCNELGIDTTSSFIVGFPDEKAEDINLTIRSFLKCHNMNSETIMSVLSVMPQTPIYNTHYKRLICYGKLLDFPSNTIEKNVKELIEKYPDIFSSFYIIPLEGIEPETIYWLRKCANLTQDYRHTIKMILNENKEPIVSINFIKLFTDTIFNLKNKSNADIHMANKCIRKIISLITKKEIREIVGDAFAIESAMAITKRNFTTEPTSKLSENTDKGLPNIISLTPYHQVVTTKYDINDLRSPMNCSPVNHKKTNRYVIVACNEEKGKVFRMKERQHNMYKIIEKYNGKPFSESFNDLCNFGDSSEVKAFTRHLYETGILQNPCMDA